MRFYQPLWAHPLAPNGPKGSFWAKSGPAGATGRHIRDEHTNKRPPRGPVVLGAHVIGFGGVWVHFGRARESVSAYFRGKKAPGGCVLWRRVAVGWLLQVFEAPGRSGRSIPTHNPPLAADMGTLGRYAVCQLCSLIQSCGEPWPRISMCVHATSPYHTRMMIRCLIWLHPTLRVVADHKNSQPTPRNRNSASAAASTARMAKWHCSRYMELEPSLKAGWCLGCLSGPE